MDGPRVVVQLALPSAVVIPDRTALGHVTAAQPELLLLENSRNFSVVQFIFIVAGCNVKATGLFLLFFCILLRSLLTLTFKNSSSKKRLANIDRFLHCSSSYNILLEKKTLNIIIIKYKPSMSVCWTSRSSSFFFNVATSPAVGTSHGGPLSLTLHERSHHSAVSNSS